MSQQNSNREDAMKNQANTKKMSKAWQILPCAIFVAFFNVFTFGTLNGQAQNPPSAANYSCNLDDVTYSGTHATLTYLFKNTSPYNFSSWNITQIVWYDVMSTETPTPIQVPLGFSFTALEIDNVPDTDIKIYEIRMTSNVAQQYFLPGGPQAGWNTLQYKVYTPPNEQGDLITRDVDALFVGGSGFPDNQFLLKSTQGLEFPINNPPPPPQQIKIDKIYVSGADLAFDLSNLTTLTVNTIECNSNLSNPNGWVPVINFSVSAPTQTEMVPISSVPSGHLFFRIRTEDNS